MKAMDVSEPNTPRGHGAHRAAAHRRQAARRLAALRAYHEAAHAVVAWLRGFQLKRISIIGHGIEGGSCEYQFVIRMPRGAGRGRAAARKRAIIRAARAAAAVAVAGTIAQDEVLLGIGRISVDPGTGWPLPLFSPGADADARIAYRLAGWVYRDAGARTAFLRRMRTATQRILTRSENWAAVASLASRLVRERALDGDIATECIRRAIARHAPVRNAPSGRNLRHRGAGSRARPQERAGFGTEGCSGGVARRSTSSIVCPRSSSGRSNAWRFMTFDGCSRSCTAWITFFTTETSFSIRRRNMAASSSSIMRPSTARASLPGGCGNAPSRKRSLASRLHGEGR